MQEKAKISAARKAVLLIFLVCGIGLSSWAPMVPFAKLALGLSEADLGVVLLALGAGAILTMPITGILINKYGSRRISLLSALIIAIFLPLLLLASTPYELAAALFVFGAGIGSVDVAMNAQAVLVQEKHGSHIMSSFHGMFSVGGLLGSIGLGFLIKAGLSPTVAAVSISALLVIIAATQFKYLLPHSEEAKIDKASFILPKGPVLVLGLMCFILFLAEGSLLDWSAVFLQFSRDFDPSLSGVGYAVFSVAMAIMRLTGDNLIHKLGPSKVVFYGTFLAGAGFLLAVAVPWAPAALAGFVLVGLGAANVVPIFFTAAGRFPNVPPSVSLPAVTTLGYAGQLAGPALIGFIAEFTSLSIALGFVGVLLFIVAFTYKHRD
ncbi:MULTISPECIES: MFS transporter [Dyadobacter]|uniref:MFS transporter n=1 Tax=Dyadobacter chenhuakuii TaxID=2909339 RepID=A0ABY4XRV2_9BACT|nr:MULTISPECIES: MFS transporter [Dyadobacter]MCE7070239.1 MFS transporter [Dyadobacter sp. CY327]MCF2492537.1 MFS transporter [Dyadobacter chenhuakuii]MCF2520446.1 MFS transporter [Dyadobacter sp. CY351]USJ33166.1 MFS transporter [Dyadobacter chenhuakuii]